MYFFSDDERKLLLRGLVPKSRQMDVAEELRGWSWHQPPMEPVFGTARLGVYEVAGRYCPTGRDVYMRRVLNASQQPNEQVVAGAFYHALLVDIFTRAKRLLYTHGVEGYRQALSLLGKADFQGEAARCLERVGSVAGGSKSPKDLREELLHRGAVLWDFEVSRISARVNEVLSRYPYINEDSLVALALPVVAEQKLNGSFLGLSPYLSADAIMSGEPLVVDLKFGEPRNFHRLGLVGYALAMEAIYEYPINVGVVVYAKFKGDRWLISKEFHLLDNELRQWFLEERDEKARIVCEEFDPGFPDECPTDCLFYKECRKGGGD